MADGGSAKQLVPTAGLVMGAAAAAIGVFKESVYHEGWVAGMMATPRWRAVCAAKSIVMAVPTPRRRRASPWRS